MAGVNPLASIAARRNQAGMSPAQVMALRHFLIRRGYDLSPHGGQIGGDMRSALDDFLGPHHVGPRLSAALAGTKVTGRRNPAAWNKEHPVLEEEAQIRGGAKGGVGAPKHLSGGSSLPMDTPAHPNAHPPVAGTQHLPTHHVAPNSPSGHQHGGGGGGGGVGGGGGFNAMMLGLLGHAGTAKMLPLSLADQIASPDAAQAAAFQNEIDQLPGAKKQAMKNIMDWYNQVQSSEQTAAGRDKAAANAGASSAADIAKGIMASVGGDASGAAGQIGSVGANDASAMKALGVNDANLAADLAPIFKLTQAGAKTQTEQQFNQGKQQLAQELAQATGQESADRANAVMQILQQNSQGRQTNFQNVAGLLNTLASLQISGANAASMAQSRQIENAYRMSEIRKNMGGGGGNGLDTYTPSQRAGLATALNNLLMDPNSGKLKSGMSWPAALQDVRNYLRTQGLNPLNRQIVGQLVAPTLANAGIQFKNPNVIYQP